jgi:hypothetical protein
MLAVVRLIVVFLPFTILRAALATITRRVVERSASSPFPAADRIAWAIALASRYLPGTNHCLTRAAAAQALFAWRNQPTDLHLGVATLPSGQLAAHAWLVHQGKVVIGGPDITAYRSLCAL